MAIPLLILTLTTTMGRGSHTLTTGIQYRESNFRLEVPGSLSPLYDLFKLTDYETISQLPRRQNSLAQPTRAPMHPHCSISNS
jgi:hypothetical protein